MAERIEGKISIGGTELNIDLTKLKGLKVNDRNNSIFTGKFDINRDQKLDEKDKIDSDGSNLIDSDEEVDLLQKFLMNIGGEEKIVTPERFTGLDKTMVETIMDSLKDIAEQQLQVCEITEITSESEEVGEEYSASVEVGAEQEVVSEETTMIVQPGWGNIRVAKEALKAQGIDNPTNEQIQKAKEAIEEANSDQCKTWKAKYGAHIPVGTKYFYANAEIKIPDLKALLGISSTNSVIETEAPSTVSPTDEIHEETCVIVNPSKQSKKTNDCWLLSGTNALLNTAWGRKALNEAIQKGSNGGYVITLKGADNKKIEVTQKELEEAKSSGLYAEGDDSLIALEIAINKYRNELHPQTEMERELNGLAINWGDGYELFHLITGKNVHRNSNLTEFGHQYPDYINKGKMDVEKALDKMKENPGEVAMVASFSNPNSDPLSKFTVDGVELSPKHAYAVVGVETGEDGKDYVILINPRNSAEKLKITKESFMRCFDAVDAISENEDSLESNESQIRFNLEF